MQRVNLNVYPKEGYFFVENDGTIVRATKGWHEVIARVAAYRKRNKLSPGNPRDEVHAQACSRNPETCREDEDPVNKKQLRVSTLKGRVLAWLATVRARQPLSFTDEGTMRARVSVCANCPEHSTIGGGCGACKKAVKAVRDELLGGRPVDGRAAGCLALSEDVGVSSWLADPTVPNGTLPGCCWRRCSPP